MESLKIVRGNDFYLMAPIRKIIFSKDEHGKEVKSGIRINMNDFSKLSVRLHEIDNTCGMPVRFTISEDDDSMLIIKIPGSEILVLKCV